MVRIGVCHTLLVYETVLIFLVFNALRLLYTYTTNHLLASVAFCARATANLILCALESVVYFSALRSDGCVCLLFWTCCSVIDVIVRQEMWHMRFIMVGVMWCAGQKQTDDQCSSPPIKEEHLVLAFVIGIWDNICFALANYLDIIDSACTNQASLNREQDRKGLIHLKM